MSIAKFRGKSALLHNENASNKTTINKSSIAPPSSLLKIEPFVPTLTTRTRKPIHRSYSTLSTTYFKRVIDQKHRTGRHLERTVLSRQRSKSSLSSSSVSQNGVCHINRPSKEQERLPDRINYDRRGLTSIPIFENEQNLRLLSLQHNLINVFHIPDDSIRKQHNIIEEVEEIRLNRPTSLHQENENNLIKAQQQRNGIITKKSLAASPTITPAILTPPGTNTNNNIINNINNNNNNNNNNNGNLLKSTFVQKSVLLHANHKYSLKKSKSFMTSYSKHLNSIKQNLQKCTMTKVKNITALEANHHPQEITENKIPEKQETGIESLKVQNNQFSPHYGAIFQNLVFLDLYDNQIEKISNLDGLKSLTVLLLGKNRIIEISGLSSLKNTLRVLDLHGNKISSVSNKLNCLQELKSLNLAGNQIRQINQNDFAGLLNLKELNLKRNKIKRVYGFNHLSSLERLWLCHNDLHKVEDMSSIAKAINLQEVTIENNPVSLAGDCVSFLVSYLPNLMMLSQMPITDQVRRAAMAWRKNKEMSDSNYSSLTSDVFSSIRREEVISNARTNWELLRSQQVLTSNKSMSYKLSPTPSLQKVTENEKTPSETEQNNRNNTKIKITKINSDTNNKTNQSKLDDDIQDFFRLPPILKPFTSSAASSEKTHSSGSSLGPNIDSSSSCYSSDNEDKMEPLNNNDQPSPPRNQKQEQVAVQVPEVNEQPPFESEDVYYDIVPKDEFKEVMVIEDTAAEISSNPNANHQEEPLQQEQQQQQQQQQQPKEESIPSNLDTNHKGNETNSNNDSNSQSDKNSNISTTSLKSESEISAGILNPPEKSIKNRVPNNNIQPTKRYMHGSLMRSQTAKPRTSTVSHNTVSNSITPCNAVASKTSKPAGEREREQGGDYLIEICGRYLNIYGLGALRFIDKQWNTQKANDVHTLNFSYINFNNIATILGRIKVRFPNAESFVFRETNISSIGQLNALAELQGITALVIDPEGNSISTKEWRLYAVYRLSHWGLKTINGVEVTEKEVERAQKEYLGLSDLVLWSLPESMLQPLLTRLRLDETCSASKLSAKEWLMKADQSLKVVVGKEALQWKRTANSQEDFGLRERGKIHFSVMIENTCNAVEKLQKLETLWPSLLLDIVRNTLLDYSQLDVYLKNVMTEVMK